MLEVVDNN